MDRRAPLIEGQTSVLLQFSTERAIESVLIRWFSHSQFSHVDFVLPSGELYGAHLDGGVRVRPAGYARFTRVKRVRIPTPRADSIYNAALSQDGAPYDTNAIFAFALPIFFPRRNWRDKSRWMCSELAAWAFERSGFFQHTAALPARRMTPGDVDLYLSPFAVVVSDRQCPNAT